MTSRSTQMSTMDHTEDIPAEIDEPPENKSSKTHFWVSKPLANSAYTKAMPLNTRRESLLTRQLHSETEHSDEEHVFARGHSTASVWSNPSVASTAELTSDDGRSAPSPAISPPLPPTAIRTTLPIIEKPLAIEPKIIGLDSITTKDPIEAGLGRKRCITFACGNKEKPKEVSVVPTSPPKRKCALRFVCPSKQAAAEPPKRAASPAPKHRRSSSSLKAKTASPASPRLSRKSPVQDKTVSAPPKRTARPLIDSDDSGAEATKFHEFASSEDEPDEWTQESTCYRNRLCVSDTLKKENVIRQLAEEVAEEEAIEEEEEEEEEEDEEREDDEEAEEEDEDDADEDLEEEQDESDAGFHSDNEEGIFGSDSEGEGSDNEWWTPGAASTAATSAEHLDHHNKITPRADMTFGSLASNSSAGISPRSRSRRPHAKRMHSISSAVPIDRPASPDLPDSTDFVCGTLDEDRPKEQAYIDHIKEREAAKHPLIPQDIDPTFPTSDPEMDEEDDEDLEDAVSSSADDMMHGSLDSLHGTARPLSPVPHKRSPAAAVSPAPTVLRAKSPAPKLRLASPPPPPRHRSPAPLTRTRTKSPAPKARPRSPAPKSRARSPAPPRARSPAPRKLFGHSPRRMRSPPANGSRMTSPPNTRRASPNEIPLPHHGLASRPNTLTIAASLPKRPGGFLLSRLGMPSDGDGSDTASPDSHHRGGRRRGAIDIVKGLEKKKQRRHEKLCQKLAAKAAARGDERKKVKPGRGCERMREVGLELQKYKGNADHIISC